MKRPSPLLFAFAALLAGCQTGTFFSMDLSVSLSDESGVPIRKQSFDLCATPVYASGTPGEETCETLSSGMDGVGATTVSDTAGVDDEVVGVSTAVRIEGTEVAGSTVGFDETSGSTQDYREFEARIEATFARADLPEFVNRFVLNGMITDPVAQTPLADTDALLTFAVSLNNDTVLDFVNAGTVSTNEFGEYSAELDLISNFLFEVDEDTIRAKVLVNGQSLLGDVLVSNVDSSADPRVIRVFASF